MKNRANTKSKKGKINSKAPEPNTYNNLKFKLAVFEHCGKGGNKEKLTTGYTIKTVTPNELHKIFISGNYVTTQIFKGSDKAKFHRKKKNFSEASVLQIDIDNDKENQEYFSLEEIRAGDSERARKVRNLAYGIYTTNSHRERHHKFRIYYVTQKPITDKDRYEALIKALASGIPYDPRPLQSASFFYGAGKNPKQELFRNILSEEQIEELIAESENKTYYQESSGIKFGKVNVSRELKKKINGKLDKLQTTKFHNRHTQLLKITRKISAFVYQEDTDFWQDFSPLFKEEIEKVAKELKKYDVPGNEFTDHEIKRTIKDGWLYGSEAAPNSVRRLYNNRPLQNMDGAPRDIIMNMRRDKLNEGAFETEAEKMDFVQKIIEKAKSKKLYLAICKFAESKASRVIRHVKPEDIISLMYAGVENTKPDKKHLRYESKNLLNYLDYFKTQSFKFENNKTGQILGFSLISEYCYNSKTKELELLALPNALMGMAAFFPSNIYGLKGKNFELGFNIWIYANRNFTWRKKNNRWLPPNYEKKPIRLKRETLCRYAKVDGYSDEYKKNQKLKMYFEKLRDLGHIKRVPEIKGKANQTYKIFLKNVYE